MVLWRTDLFIGNVCEKTRTTAIARQQILNMQQLNYMYNNTGPAGNGAFYSVCAKR
jgi:hypothetical protein